MSTAQRQREHAVRSRSDLLAPLPRPTITPLTEFATYLASLEVDYMIFMARKAVRLHDLLVAAGAPIPQAVIVTDHILDQSLIHLVGKRVAIVDDTLILGTTIAEAELHLINAGVGSIIKVVFSVDEDNWCRPLASVDKYFMGFNSSAMLNFCAAEVHALALAAIPYLTDFPVSKPIRIGRSQLDRLHNLPGWDSFPLSSAQQQAAEVFYYTHLPISDDLSDLAAPLGELAAIIEIIKVRSFVFTGKRGHIARIIPIVTLKPLAEGRIAQMFDTLISGIATYDESARTRLRLHLISPRAKLRFLQYFISLIVGKGFLATLREGLGQSRPLRFDLEEASRTFGPWLRGDIEALHTAADQFVRGGNSPSLEAADIKGDQLPRAVRALIKADIERFLGTNASDGDEQSRTLFSDLVQVFVQFHLQHELPARKEARLLGRAILTANSAAAPHRDRLKFGLSWEGLVEKLFTQQKLNIRRSRSRLMSLFLDALVDLGIAVPILSSVNGVMFRAYRHGEIVPFEKQEAAMAYEVAQGFLEGNGRPEIPRLTMEKLLVSLLRVGVANEFLKSYFYGLDGAQRVARIAFHRHGAVATYGDEPSIYADSQDCWLSMYLVRTKVLARTASRAYVLGTRPDAAMLGANANLNAHELGFLIGKLTRRPGSAEAVLIDENDLAILATCAHPRDAAGAVVAELRIFERWFDEQHDSLLRLDFKSDKACRTALDEFARSNGYAAFNSARLKLRGHWDNKPARIVAEGEIHLRNSGAEGAFLANRWQAMWAPVLDGASVHERASFNDALHKLGGEMLSIAIGMLTMELALAARVDVTTHNGRQRYKRICSKALSYLEAIAEYAATYHAHDKALSRLRELCEANTPMTDAEAGYRFGHKYLAVHRPAARSLVVDVGEQVRHYGRDRQRTDFQFALWYDVIGSLGEKSGLNGPEMVDYRARIATFKTRANAAMLGVQRDAGRGDTMIVFNPYSLETSDDEKDILFAKGGASHWQREAVRILLGLAQTHRVALRMLAINADFAGRAPHSYRDSPDIVGQAFWEYGSRLKKWVRAREAELSGERSNTPHSFLWLGDVLAETADEYPFVTWIGGSRTGRVQTVIDDRAVGTVVKGGPVWFGDRLQ